MKIFARNVTEISAEKSIGPSRPERPNIAFAETHFSQSAHGSLQAAKKIVASFFRGFPISQ